MNKALLQIRFFRKSILVFISFLLIVLICVSCNNGVNSKESKEKTESKNKESVKGFPKFEFTKELHKFGKISEGETLVCDFLFKNVGTRDLIISNIETSCGCAVAKWDEKPIKPGYESQITVEFNSKGRYGKQYKVITIFCNTISGNKELIITAQIK